MHELPFTKMQGLGNDFIVIDSMINSPPLKGGNRPVGIDAVTPERAKQICHRRFGIGADQILWLKPPHDITLGARVDARMEILNADGSVAEMCGNGIRAVALYLQKYHHPAKSEFQIETLGGIKTVQIQEDQVHVDMGVPQFGSDFSSEGEISFFEVDVGNPHAVIFVSRIEEYPVEQIGPFLENHSRFPNRTNVEFVEVKSPSSIRVKVWERGAGLTLACGTGACAAAVAALVTGKAKSPLSVELPGGSLQISWQGSSNPIFMTGPAQEVYRGVYWIK
jgi:diaminopimelate epimerase